MKKTAGILAIALLTSNGYAEVYKWKDSEGHTHYSDRPVEGAEVVKSVPLTTYRPAAVPQRSTSGQSQQETETVAYSDFSFVSPANDATIRDNTGNIAVQLSLNPPLQSGHDITLIIDGTPLEKTMRATTFTLSNLDRGTHTLQAAIVDAEGNRVIETQPTTVHMRRISILNPNNPNNPNNQNNN